MLLYVCFVWYAYISLWLYVSSFNILLRRTDARLRRTDAHSIKWWISWWGWMFWVDIGLRICLFWWLFGWVWGGLGWFLDDLGLILMDFGCMLGWCWDGFLTVLEGFRMNVGWICGGRCLEFCFLMFSWLSEFYDFFEVDGNTWGSLWQCSGRVWQGYAKTVARLLLSYGKVLETLHGRV